MQICTRKDKNWDNIDNDLKSDSDSNEETESDSDNDE